MTSDRISAEALLQLDTKLRDFVDTHIEVENYRQKVKYKYDALDLLDAAKITKIFEKFKGKHLDIALEWQRTKPRCQNFNFGTLKILSFFARTGPQIRRSAGPQLRNSEVRRQLTACSQK